MPGYISEKEGAVSDFNYGLAIFPDGGRTGENHIEAAIDELNTAKMQ